MTLPFHEPARGASKEETALTQLFMGGIMEVTKENPILVLDFVRSFIDRAKRQDYNAFLALVNEESFWKTLPVVFDEVRATRGAAAEADLALTIFHSNYWGPKLADNPRSLLERALNLLPAIRDEEGLKAAQDFAYHLANHAMVQKEDAISQTAMNFAVECEYTYPEIRADGGSFEKWAAARTERQAESAFDQHELDG